MKSSFKLPHPHQTPQPSADLHKLHPDVQRNMISHVAPAFFFFKYFSHPLIFILPRGHARVSRDKHGLQQLEI